MLRQASSNGFTTLAHVDSRLQSMRQQLHEMEQHAERYSQQIAAVNNRESTIYADLAAINLSSLDDADSLRQTLTSAERQAKNLLQQREQAIQALVIETEQSLDVQKQLEADRETQAKAIEELSETLHAQVQATQAKLLDREDYRAAQDAAQKAVDTVDAAEQKAQRSAKEHRHKASDYEADSIFMYLWKRRYGTKDYRAGRVARLLDRWVADHVGYEEQRRNYYMLQEIPKRLEVHVSSLRDAADQAMAELERIEHEAETQDGVIALEEKLDAMRDDLNAADEAIENEEIHYGQCLAKRDEYARAEDKLYQQAIAVLSEGLKHQSLDRLRHQAEQSAGFEDDTLVGELAELQQEKRSLTQSHQTANRSSAEFAGRLHALEKLRQNFKQHRFDAPHSQFTNAPAVSDAIDDFAQGLITARELWRLIERSQRFVRRQTYPNYGRRPGSMRFPRGIRIPSNWGGMGGGNRGGGIRFPTGGGGGGFKTGGGF